MIWTTDVPFALLWQIPLILLASFFSAMESCEVLRPVDEHPYDTEETEETDCSWYDPDTVPCYDTDDTDDTDAGDSALRETDDSGRDADDSGDPAHTDSDGDGEHDTDATDTDTP